MTLELRRVIVFAAGLNSLSAFYRDVLGLVDKHTPDDPRTWLEQHRASRCTTPARVRGTGDHRRSFFTLLTCKPLETHSTLEG